MAALRVVGGARGGPAPHLLPPPRRGAAGGGLLEGLWSWRLQEWGERMRRQQLRRLNQPLLELQEAFGEDLAAASFTLSLGGAVRFQGRDQWIRGGGQGGGRDPSPELLQLRLRPLLGVDLRDTSVTYRGFDNLVPLQHLELLDLSGCPQVDDWTLSRLQALGGTLRVLSLARCPLVTERGLATLHHLRKLQRLDVSGLKVPNPGLLRLLLEEMMPRCQLVGMEEEEEEEEEAGGRGTEPSSPLPHTQNPPRD